MTKLPNITKTQHTIISLLFRFRFLDRTQIQKILNHKDYKTINDWLRDLSEKEYIGHIYPLGYPNHKKPVYFLIKNGIALVKAENSGNAVIAQKLYREKDRSKSFIDSCQLLADIYLDLLSRNTADVDFKMSVKNDYENHALGEMLKDISPKAFIEQTANDETNQYFLEIFINCPKELLRMRIKRYISYYESSEWEPETGNPFPTVLIICPDDEIFAYVRRYTKTKIALLDEPDLNIQLTEISKVKEFGITGDVWTKLN
jgi:hypothetical protein